MQSCLTLCDPMGWSTPGFPVLHCFPGFAQTHVHCHVWMWELDYKEGWEPKNWWFWTVVLEKTLESPLDCKEIQPVHPNGNQPWIFTGRTDVEAEAPVLWPPDAKSQLIRKDPDAGKDWRQEEKGTTEDKMVEWHHWLHGHEFEQVPGDGEGQRSQVCCSPWGCKKSNTTEWLNSSNQCPLSQWCHPTISSSVSPFSSCPQSFPSDLSPTHQLRWRIQVELPCAVMRVLLYEPRRKCSRSLGIHNFTF